MVITNGSPHHDWARYTFTSRGGGLKLVELLDYPETISARWTKTKAESDTVASLNTRAAVPVLAILGDTNLVGDGNFTLTQNGNVVRAEKVLPNGLRLVKEFHPGANYLLNADVRLENTTGQPLAVPAQEWVVGTATPMDVDDNNFSVYGGAMWYRRREPARLQSRIFQHEHVGSVRGSADAAKCLSHGRPATSFGRRSITSFSRWRRCRSSRPTRSSRGRSRCRRFRASNWRRARRRRKGVQTALVYPAQTLAANSSVERQIVFFAGPKEYRTLARIGAQLQNRADLVMNFGSGFVSFWGIGTFFAKLLLSGMNWLHDVTRIGYGWTIVVITVLLRGMFWPLMAATHALDEADAGARAGNESAQGKIQGRPAEGADEAVGTLQEAQDQSDERLPADDAPDAGVHGLFHDDPQRHRTARRAFPVGHGFVEAGHAVHDSGPAISRSTCCRC